MFDTLANMSALDVGTSAPGRFICHNANEKIFQDVVNVTLGGVTRVMVWFCSRGSPVHVKTCDYGHQPPGNHLR